MMTRIKKNKGRTIGDLLHGSHGDLRPVFQSGPGEVLSVEYDSRRVIPGSLFVAITGFESDGHAYVETAVEAGAASVIVARERAEEFQDLEARGVTLLSSRDTRTALSYASAAFYGHPSRSMTIIGVTGTNGKTSITYMLESIFQEAGHVCGVIGTINHRWGDVLIDAANTTPESRDLQKILCDMKNAGVDTVLMEVSSHALELHRADHIEFDGAIFTNLTQDHLDFHKNFGAYFAAKKRLFELLEGGAGEHFAVVNRDDPYGEKLLSMGREMPYPMFSYGIENSADYMPEKASIRNEISGLSYSMARPIQGLRFNLTITGSFHVYNSLAAAAAAHRAGIDFDIITKGLESLQSVPGRFDVIESGLGFSIVIDYAHTSDALEKLLKSVMELPHKRILTVFGCGGNRDRTKRPLMGRAAEENSDLVIVTSDNPREEDPLKIIDEITEGLREKTHHIVPDRREAIREGVRESRDGDILVIAGKGHEDYQIIGTKKIHFDDREVVEEACRERGGR